MKSALMIQSQHNRPDPNGPVVSMLTTVDEWETLKQVWDRLLPQSERDHIFLTHSWLRCWWDAFGDDKRLCLLVVQQGSTILCIAPLMVVDAHSIGRIVRTLAFIGTPEIDYTGLVGTVNANTVNALAAFIVKHHEIWDRIDLAQIPEGDNLQKLLVDAFTGHGLPTRTRHADQCLGYKFEGDATKRATFLIRKGHEVKRLLNFFKGEGGVVVERIESRDEIHTCVDQLMHLHITRWRSTPTPSQFCDIRFRSFYHTLIDRLHSDGSICFVQSRNGMTPLAMSLNYEYKGTIFHYTLAYNPFYTKKSPGNLHVILQSEQLVQTGFDLDLARGAGPYKKVLSNWQRANMQIIVYESGLSRKMADWWESAKASSLGHKATANRQLMEWKMRLQHRLAEKGIVRFPLWMLRALFRRIVRTATVTTYKCADNLDSADISKDVRLSDASSATAIATFLGLQLESSAYQLLKREIETPGAYWIVGTPTILGVAQRRLADSDKGCTLTNCEISLIADFERVLKSIITKELESSPMRTCFLETPSKSRISTTLSEWGTERVSQRRSLFILGRRIF